MNAKEWFSQQSFNGREGEAMKDECRARISMHGFWFACGVPHDPARPHVHRALDSTRDSIVMVEWWPITPAPAADEPEPRICRRCGSEERGEEGETYCRPDTLHDYPPK